MNSIVEKLAKKLLPEFRKIADQINQTIPNVSAEVESHEAAALTEYHNYSFGISCVFLGGVSYEADEVADNVALEVSVFHLTTTPRINADVCWGHPSGHIEAEIFSNWTSSDGLPEVSDEVLEDLYRNLPRLYEALFKALNRRKPGDE